MIQVPSAAEHCKQLDDIHGMSQDVIDSHVEFAKLHREAILEAAAEEARTCIKYWRNAPDETIVDKDSILNSYPVELIK